jgi:plasmid stability protein
MSKKPAQPQDKYVLRLPDGMRDRIKMQADRNGRSMNAEIVQALEQFFPPEPSTEELMDRIHEVMESSERFYMGPYKDVLLQSLDRFAERLSTGIEFDRFQSTTKSPDALAVPDTAARRKRFHRAGRFGITTEDLERELRDGLLRFFGPGEIDKALGAFEADDPRSALRTLRLDMLKFRDEASAHRAIEKEVSRLHSELHGWQLPPGLVPDDE